MVGWNMVLNHQPTRSPRLESPVVFWKLGRWSTSPVANTTWFASPRRDSSSNGAIAVGWNHIEYCLHRSKMRSGGGKKFMGKSHGKISVFPKGKSHGKIHIYVNLPEDINPEIEQVYSGCECEDVYFIFSGFPLFFPFYFCFLRCYIFLGNA